MVSPTAFQFDPDDFHQVLIKMQNLATCQKIKLYIKRKFDHETKLPSPQVSIKSTYEVWPIKTSYF